MTGPRLLGHATDLVFAGVFSRQVPAGTTQAEAVAQLRAAGHGTQADLLASLDITPGQGMDFGAIGTVLIWVLVVYAVAGICGVLQARLANTALQRVISGLREDVQAKISRLPLRHFDRQQRGEVLSRVTNDIDNLGQSLQQSMSQIVVSLLTIVGVLVDDDLDLVGARADRASSRCRCRSWSRPGSASSRSRSSSTSGGSPVGSTATSRRCTPGTRWSGRSVGRRSRRRSSVSYNEKLYAASWRAQFVSGLMQPAMMFIGNVNYVLVAVIGGLRVASGSLSIGEVQAFIQYSRQFSQPLSQIASMANMVQSGVASAERVFDLLDAVEQEPDPANPAHPGATAGQGRVRARRVPVRAGQAADRGPVADRRARPHGGDCRADGRREDHADQPADAVLRGHRRADHP